MTGARARFAEIIPSLYTNSAVAAMAAISGASTVDKLSSMMNIRSHSVVKCVNFDVSFVLFTNKTVRTDIKVSLEQFLATIAMIIHIGKFLAAKFAKIIVAERVNMVSKRIMVCIWKWLYPISHVGRPDNFFKGRQNSFCDFAGRGTFSLGCGFDGTEAFKRFVHFVNKMRSNL
jgi:hypothetical protein